MRVCWLLVLLVAPQAALGVPPCGQQRQVVVQKQFVTQYQAVPHLIQQNQVLYQNGYAIQLQQVNPAQYYQVGPSIQEEAVAERIAKKVELKLANKQNYQRPGPSPTAGVSAEPGSVVLTQRCSNCHKDGSKAVHDDGAPILFSPDGGWIGSRDQAIKAITLSKLGAMPPKGDAVSDDDFIKLQAFLEKLPK